MKIVPAKIILILLLTVETSNNTCSCKYLDLYKQPHTIIVWGCSTIQSYLCDIANIIISILVNKKVNYVELL